MKKKFLIMLAMVAVLAVSLIVVVGCEGEGRKQAATAPTINRIEYGVDWLKVLDFEEDEGVEFSLDKVTWQDSCEFKNLTPNTEYTLYVRMKETEIYLVGKVATKKFTTLKYVQTKVPNVTFERRQCYTVELTQTENEEYEYSYDKGATYVSEKIHTFKEMTTHDVLIRYKATDTHYAGEPQILQIVINAFDTGLGTQENPYIISNYEQFIKIGEKGYYKLIKDIYYPKEFVDVSIYAAKSYIDGNYKKIIAPKLEKNSRKIYFGVFSDVLSVKNLTIEDAQLNILGMSDRIGILAANGTYVENCHVSGEIVTNTLATIGVLVARLYNSSEINAKVIDCSAKVIVDDENENNKRCFGGLVGICDDDSIIDNSSTTFEIKKKAKESFSSAIIGGIVGIAGKTKITNCYSKGSMSVELMDNGYQSLSFGGIVGKLNADIIDCFAEMDISIDISKMIYPAQIHQILIGGMIGENTENEAGQEIKNCLFMGKIRIIENEKEINCKVDSVSAIPLQEGALFSADNNYSCGSFPLNMTNHFSTQIVDVRELTADVLGWDESIWLFEEGKLPQLRLIK